MAMDFSVIIVHHNAADYLRNCLDSVKKTSAEIPHETIVVDNASKDVDLLTRDFPWVKWILNKNNAGFGAAVNQGVAASQGEVVVLLNHDAQLLHCGLQELQRFFLDKKSGEIGAVGGRLFFSDGTLQPSCGPFPHLLNLLWRVLLPRKDRRYYLRELGKAPRRVDWVTGAFMAFQRRVFDRIGGFDPGFFLYYEDVDFCMRAKKAGCPSYHVPQAMACHHHPHAARQDRPPGLDAIIRDSRLLYFKKHRPAWEAWVLEKLTAPFSPRG